IAKHEDRKQGDRDDLHVGGREGRSYRRVLDQRHVKPKRRPIARQHGEHPWLLCHSLKPGQVEGDGQRVVIGELEADLYEGIDGAKGQEAEEHFGARDAGPPATSSTPAAMSDMASMRAAVIRSPKKMRPPIMTKRISTHATMTPCHSGTTDRNANHMKNSN